MFSKYHAAAIRYAELGYKVLPVIIGEKRPATAHGVYDATDDREKIDRIWSERPNYNVAIATAGLVVVDVDNRKASLWPDDPDLAVDLALSAGAVSVTPSGGRHYFFRKPVGYDIRCSVGAIADNVDIRSDGGYVLVPPSVVSGRPYVWVKDREIISGPKCLPEPPQWLTDLIVASTTSPLSKSPNGVIAIDSVIPEGVRNDSLFRIGCRLRRLGLEYPEILAALQQVNLGRCKPPLGEEEVGRIASSAAKYEPDQIEKSFVECTYWSARLESDGGERSEEPDYVGDIPKELMINAPKIISKTVEYILRTSYRTQPELSLGSTLAFISAASGTRIRDIYKTCGNVYCVGVGPPGCGKERTRQAIRDILAASDVIDDLLGPEDVASAQGLLSVIEKKSEILIQWDEFGRVLRTTGNAANNPFLFHIGTVLLRLYTAAGGAFTGVAYSKDWKFISQPHLAIWATTTPDDFFESLNDESIGNGLVSRLLVFLAREKMPKLRRPEQIQPDDEIVAWLKLRRQRSIGQTKVYTYTEDAESVISEFAEFCDERVTKCDERFASIFVRATEQARKLALLGADASDVDPPPVIDREVAFWAVSLVKHLVMRLYRIIYERTHRTVFEERYKKVLSWIRQKESVTRTELYRYASWLKPKELDEIVAALAESRHIEIIHTPSGNLGGRPKTIYRAL